MRKQILAAGAAMGLAFTGLAPVAVAEIPLTLNAGAARWYFSSDRDLSDMNTPFAGLEWAFSDMWAAEISYAQDDANNTAVPGSSTEVVLANLGMRMYGGSYIVDESSGAGRLRPYAVVGAGYFSENPNFSGGEKTEDTTVNAGLGVRWMITPRFGASLDGRTVYNVDKSNNDTIAYLGLNYFFGTVQAAAAAAPTTRVDATGCPLPVAQVASIKLKVNFAFDSSVVTEQYFADLAELAAFLKRFDQVDVTIEGHTDSVGSEEYNQQLSERRARAVADMLVNSHGIAASRLNAVGYGESRPVASNDTAEGRAQNRRVMATLEVEYTD